MDYQVKYVGDGFYATNHPGRWVVSNLSSPDLQQIGAKVAFANLIIDLFNADTEEQVIRVLLEYEMDPNDFGFDKDQIRQLVMDLH